MDIKAFWDAVLRQDADAIREYFHPDAWVNWHNTNEHFTVEEFIRANCEYPGEWDGEVEQIITTDAHIITATHVYCAIHNKDMYWTGEKVMQAQDRFRTFLAIHDGKVVGYMDVTYIFQENEPFDLFVLEEYRRRGYGRKLLAKALEMNQPNGMMLLVDVDNDPAIRLYESMGFVKVQGQNNLTAHWTVPEIGR